MRGMRRRRGSVQSRTLLASLLADAAVAEADGNRTRQAEVLDFTGFEDREGHQAPVRLRGVTLAGPDGASA